MIDSIFYHFQNHGWINDILTTNSPKVVYSLALSHSHCSVILTFSIDITVVLVLSFSKNASLAKRISEVVRMTNLVIILTLLDLFTTMQLGGLFEPKNYEDQCAQACLAK
jgi:hypothetical protein